MSVSRPSQPRIQITQLRRLYCDSLFGQEIVLADSGQTYEGVDRHAAVRRVRTIFKENQLTYSSSRP